MASLATMPAWTLEDQAQLEADLETTRRTIRRLEDAEGKAVSGEAELQRQDSLTRARRSLARLEGKT